MAILVIHVEYEGVGNWDQSWFLSLEPGEQKNFYKLMETNDMIFCFSLRCSQSSGSTIFGSKVTWENQVPKD